MTAREVLAAIEARSEAVQNFTLDDGGLREAASRMLASVVDVPLLLVAVRAVLDRAEPGGWIESLITTALDPSSPSAPTPGGGEAASRPDEVSA